MIKKLICRLFGHKIPSLPIFHLTFEEYDCLRCNRHFKPSNDPLIPDLWAKTVLDITVSKPSIFREDINE